MITNEEAKFIVDAFGIDEIVEDAEDLDCYEPEVILAFLALVEMTNKARDKSLYHIADAGKKVERNAEVGKTIEQDEEPLAQIRKKFKIWAEKEGYDIAYTHTYDSTKFIFLNPMTADLWRTWQAALSSAQSEKASFTLSGILCEIGLLDGEDTEHGIVLNCGNGQFVTLKGLSQDQTRELVTFICEKVVLTVQSDLDSSAQEKENANNPAEN